MDDRGQLYTLEGITAGLVILVGLFFALQATTATPGAAGTLNPHAEQQDRASAQAVLNGMNASTLRDAVLYWEHAGPHSQSFHCTPPFADHYPGYADIADGSSTGSETCDEDTGSSKPSPAAQYAGALPAGENHLPPNEFGQHLSERFGEGYSFNVVVTYHNSSASDDFSEQLMVYQGQPDASAVRASASVVLLDHYNLLRQNGDRTGPALQDSASNFYAPDNSSGTEFYNELNVEVVVWRG